MSTCSKFYLGISLYLFLKKNKPAEELHIMLIRGEARKPKDVVLFKDGRRNLSNLISWEKPQPTMGLFG